MSPPIEVTAAAGDNSGEDIDFAFLSEVLDELADLKRGVSERSGSLSSRVKQINEENNWNKQALAMIRKIADMSTESRADFLRTFETMFDVMMEMSWRQEARDLLDDIENADPDGES